MTQAMVVVQSFNKHFLKDNVAVSGEKEGKEDGNLIGRQMIYHLRKD